MLTQIVLFIFAVFLVLDERFYVRFATAGSGLVRVMDLVVPLTALSLLFLSRKRILPWFRNKTLKYCLPYLFAGLLLPLLGVVGGDYPARTLLTTLVSIRSLAMVALGIWLAQQSPRTRLLIARWIVICIMIEALVAVCQFITFKHLFENAFLRWLNDWDIRSMTDYKDTYLIGARSSGTFLNPNTLGVWSVVTLSFSVTVLSGFRGVACTTASLLTLVLSQSRGSLAAFLAGLIFAVLYLPWMNRKALFGLAAATIIGLGLFRVVFGGFGAFGGGALQSTEMQDRFENGLAVLSEGSSADSNAQSRVDAWIDAISFFKDHPLGTGGEPQYTLHILIDNQYVATTLQGSIPYLATLLLVLFGACMIPMKSGVRPFILLTTINLAVNSISAMPFQYPPVAIYWLTLGYAALPTSVALARGPRNQVGYAGARSFGLQPAMGNQLMSS